VDKFKRKVDEVHYVKLTIPTNQDQINTDTRSVTIILQVCASYLELVDLIVDEVVHLGVETSWETLLGGELIDGWKEAC
jgi:hypothetical protein